MPHIKGYGPHNIPIYDNPDIIYNNPYHFGRKGSIYECLFYGVKYECVEFIRRYYIHVYGVTFQEIDNASDLIKLTHGIDIITKKHIPFQISKTPQPGDIIVWKKEAPYEKTGHVAIVVDVLSKKRIRVVEQNGKTYNGWRTINIDSRIIGFIRI